MRILQRVQETFLNRYPGHEKRTMITVRMLTIMREHCDTLTASRKKKVAIVCILHQSLLLTRFLAAYVLSALHMIRLVWFFFSVLSCVSCRHDLLS